VKYESSKEKYHLGIKVSCLDFRARAQLYNHPLGWARIKGI